MLGVDACPGGWVGVVLDPDLRASVFTALDDHDLLELVAETASVRGRGDRHPHRPAGHQRRAADAEARRVLVGKSSSVFSTPTRAALEADTYAERRAANLAATRDRTSVSAQAYALREKVLQVDAWVRSGPACGVIEVHPEVSFARWPAPRSRPARRTCDGVRRVVEVLADHGIAAPPWFRGAPFGEDDLLDACAAAWSAVRHSLGVAESFPAAPEVVSDGIPAADLGVSVLLSRSRSRTP